LILGIDASNIRWGGGITHLVEMLREIKPSEYGFDKVVIWGCTSVLDRLEDKPWLIKACEPMLNRSLLFRFLWQKFILHKRAIKTNCSILFVPGGLYGGNFSPVVTMSQNLLPFEFLELIRYKWSLMTVRLLLLRYMQSISYSRSDGIIFLTLYAQDVVMSVVGKSKALKKIIPHGINPRFVFQPKPQLPFSSYSKNAPYQILYVSTIDMFKHQCEIIEAVALLRKQGYPIALNLVGGAYAPALRRMRSTIKIIDPGSEFIRYLGEIPYAELHEQYKLAELGVFASTCENMPNILLELMASGLPIACSNFGPMPNMLEDGGVYFNPECPLEIRDALKALLDDPELRFSLAKKSSEGAKKYSWGLCADETFQFLAKVARSAS
jgi:glycosyltransferase involved in cell wall biosynthesis